MDLVHMSDGRRERQALIHKLHIMTEFVTL